MIPVGAGPKFAGLRNLKVVLRKLPDGLDIAEADLLLHNEKGYRAIMYEVAKTLIIAAQAAADLADLSPDGLVTLINEVKIPQE